MTQTMQLIGDRLGCEPDALSICEAIDRLKNPRPSMTAREIAGSNEWRRQYGEGIPAGCDLQKLEQMIDAAIKSQLSVRTP